MSLFRINCTAKNPKDESCSTRPVEVLVDTGSELSWLPAEELTAIGIEPRRERVFQTADGKRLEREVGYAILKADEFETIDEVVFAQPGDMNLLGVRTMEGFGVMVDNLAHRLVATTTIAA